MTQPPPPAALEGLDAVFHLAGDPVAEGRWTAGKKQRIKAIHAKIGNRSPGIVRESLMIAGQICIFSNQEINVLTVGGDKAADGAGAKRVKEGATP